jgi:hypothetical protein
MHSHSQCEARCASRIEQRHSRHLPPRPNALSVYTRNRRRRAAGSQPHASGSVAYGGCAHSIRLGVLSTNHASVVLHSSPSYSNPLTAPFAPKGHVPPQHFLGRGLKVESVTPTISSRTEGGSEQHSARGACTQSPPVVLDIHILRFWVFTAQARPSWRAARVWCVDCVSTTALYNLEMKLNLT